jgi:hypothetical protein
MPVATPKLYRLKTRSEWPRLRIKGQGRARDGRPTQVEHYETHRPNTFESDKCRDPGRIEQLLGENTDKVHINGINGHA